MKNTRAEEIRREALPHIVEAVKQARRGERRAVTRAFAVYLKSIGGYSKATYTLDAAGGLRKKVAAAMGRTVTQMLDEGRET